MATLADVFQELNALKTEGVIREYALGGATAALFYSEPVRTYDVDVFVLMPVASDSSLVRLRPIYDWARNRGFTETAEHIVIHGVPVQFLPAHNGLAEEAVISARDGLRRDNSAGHLARASGRLGAAGRGTTSAGALQRQELPLVRRQRPLRPWERPWPIDP